MAEELLYTSAPQGLRPGSVGFCTVQASAGMPAPMLQGLESLSAYRHPQTPGDPRNPVSWSHVRLNIGGKVWAVVSRVADAGFDFTQRSNKLAHHVVLTPSERPAGGPAWLVAQDGFLEDRWDGAVKERTRLHDIPQGDQAPAICRTWKRVTGDAGWAGVLAEAFLNDPTHQACVRFDLGMPVLELLKEAIALLPIERRWEVTFSTYATTLPQTATCHWRCLLNGSMEANEARRLARALQWNLSAMGPLTQTSPLIEAARTGIMPEEEVVFASVPEPKPTRRRTADHPVDNQTDDEVDAAATYDFATEIAAPPTLPPRPYLQRSSEQKPALLPWIAGGLTGLAVLCVLVIFFVTRPPVLKPAEETIAANPAGHDGTAASPAGSEATQTDGSTKKAPVQIGPSTTDPLLAANTTPTGSGSIDIHQPAKGDNPPGQPSTPTEKLTVPESTPIKPPPPNVSKVVYIDSPYLKDNATTEKAIKIPLPEGFREAAESSPVTMQLFAPEKLLEEKSFANNTFTRTDNKLIISWTSNAIGSPRKEAAAWTLLEIDSAPQLTFEWKQPTDTAKDYLRLCAVQISTAQLSVFVLPKPLPVAIPLKPNLKWNKAAYKDMSDKTELEWIGKIGPDFVVREAILDTKPSIHYQSTSPSGLAKEVAPLTHCQINGTISSDGFLRLDVVSKPSRKEYEERQIDLNHKWNTRRHDEPYEAALTVNNTKIGLDTVGLNRLPEKLQEFDELLKMPDGIEKKKKPKIQAALDSIRKDFVIPYQQSAEVIEKLKVLDVENAILTRLSFGYEIRSKGLPEPLFVELAHFGDEKK